MIAHVFGHKQAAPRQRVQILSMLCEGGSMRSTSWVADVSINTVYKMLIDAGEARLAYQDQTLYNLPCKRLQLDEAWSFVYTKQRNVAKKAPESAATFGHGLRSARTRNSFHRGA